MTCPECGDSAQDAGKYCDGCGARLTSPLKQSARCECKEAKYDDHDACTVCGRERPLLASGNHVEHNIDHGLGAVTNRGKRHKTNQDALRTFRVHGEHPAAVIVVCDGVSSALDSETASQAAAHEVAEYLRHAIACGSVIDTLSAERAMRVAIQYAHEGVCALPQGESDEELCGTTIVAAIVRNDVATIGWVGDSRAYAFTPCAAHLLTWDHSWVNEMVDAGALTLEVALQSPEAHAITRCLGPLNGPEDPEASVTSVELPPGTCLVLCSDGVWNEVEEAEDLRKLVGPHAAGAVSNARRLVEHSLSCGGRDNITAAILMIPGPLPAPAQPAKRKTRPRAMLAAATPAEASTVIQAYGYSKRSAPEARPMPTLSTFGQHAQPIEATTAPVPEYPAVEQAPAQSINEPITVRPVDEITAIPVVEDPPPAIPLPVAEPSVPQTASSPTSPPAPEPQPVHYVGGDLSWFTSPDMIPAGPAPYEAPTYGGYPAQPPFPAQTDYPNQSGYAAQANYGVPSGQPAYDNSVGGYESNGLPMQTLADMFVEMPANLSSANPVSVSPSDGSVSAYAAASPVDQGSSDSPVTESVQARKGKVTAPISAGPDKAESFEYIPF